MNQKSILFVCTGNVFRSMSAEYAFKKYLLDNKIINWRVSSAGISAEKEAVDAKTLEILKKLGVKNINIKRKKLTKKMLHDYDIVVAMAQNHLNFIKSNLNYDNVLLFDELAVNKKSSIWDIEDEVKDYKTNRGSVEHKIERTVKEIFRKTPLLFKKANERYYLFCDSCADYTRKYYSSINNHLHLSQLWM